MVIRTRDDWIRSLNSLKPEDKEDIKFVIQQLQKIIDSSEVSEESIKSLNSITMLLNSLREKHIGYLILWLKQGFMED
tara:strand:+ start:1142 stop:1375 length:234 start_codon:yes stop_codon:yes gene_type:complete